MADMVYGEDDGKEVSDDEEEEEMEEEEMEKEGEVVEEYVVDEKEVKELQEEIEEEGEEEGEEEEEEKEEEKKEEVLDKDVCRYCHQRGHKERKCPVLHPELVKQPRMKEKKNISELAIRDKVDFQ